MQHFSENRIEIVRSGAFQNLESLEFLSLATKKIEYFNSKTFSSQKSLQNLGFEKTRSSTYTPTNLKYISMEFNFIKFLPDDIFII